MAILHGNDTLFDNLEHYRLLSRASLDDLMLVKTGAARNASDRPLVLYASARNEAAFLEGFLTHYRSLGVSRFVIVDNGSIDETRHILESADDVDLYVTDADYRLANYGMHWIDGLIWRDSTEPRWLLVVDIDELLIFDNHQAFGLQRLVDHVERDGMKRLLAPMVDLYEIEPGSRYFDAAPDKTKYSTLGVKYSGGVRRRMNTAHGIAFGPTLTKYPLIYYDAETCFANTHFPSPIRRNHLPCFARLLHTKMLGDFAATVRRAVAENRFYNNSAGYRNYERWLGSDLRYAKTERYTGPDAIIEAGLMGSIE